MLKIFTANLLGPPFYSLSEVLVSFLYSTKIKNGRKNSHDICYCTGVKCCFPELCACAAPGGEWGEESWGIYNH